MRRILIIGDVHGKIGGYFDLLDDFIERHRHDTADLYSLQVGDFGFKDTYHQRANWFDKTHRYDIENHQFFGGNHDQYPIPEWAGHLGDFGEVSFIPNSFFVRGAKSIDKESRTMGYDWWPEEQLDWKQSRKALDEYIRVKPKHVFSHDAPQELPQHMFSSVGENQSTNTGKLLSEMLAAHRPETWTFGHWHETESVEMNGTLFRCLGELETAELYISEYEYNTDV